MTISTQSALREALDEIRGRDHATAGFTIAAAGALAAGLGQATVGISGGDTARIGETTLRLRDMGDEDAAALNTMIALRDVMFLRGFAVRDRPCGDESLRHRRDRLHR